MPERYGLSRAQRLHTLSKAEETGQVVRVNCMHCRITHRFRCRDLLQLFGDVAIDEVARHFRCEACKQKDYLRALFELPWGHDIGRIRIRTLVKVKTVRRPVWKDDVW